MLRLARFLRCYLADAAPGVTLDEVRLEAGELDTPALLLRPRVRRRQLPAWVVLHGVTVPGMRHAAMLRFGRALAASGAVVLVPEVEPWKRLRIDPGYAGGIIAAAARFLGERPEVEEGGATVVGFSFGATQALVTAAGRGSGTALRSVVGFGGYCDLARTVEFMLTGEHEWGGVRYRADPDPYGRWIVVANYLAATSGYSGMEGAASAAHHLAAEAGRRGVYAGDPAYDPLKAELRRRLSPGERRVWDVVAHPTGTAPDAGAARALAAELAEAALRVHPRLDPRPALRSLDRRAVLAHGRRDRLIPYTETLRLASHLPASTRPVVRITSLFAHSGGAGGVPWSRYPAELWRYAALLHRALGA